MLRQRRALCLCHSGIAHLAPKRLRIGEDCLQAIRKGELGLVDADLGRGLMKQRIPRRAQGAARGSRAVVFYRRAEVAMFLHLFAESAKANLAKSELDLS